MMQYFWCLHVAPSWLNFSLTRISLHSPSRNWVYLSNLLLVDDSLPHFLSVIWVTVLWIIFDLITFWSSFAAGSELARRSGDSARPGRVPASPCSPPAQCHLKENWMTWFTNFLFKWISSEDLFLSTQTPDKWKAQTRSCGCNVNMSAGRASI